MTMTAEKESASYITHNEFYRAINSEGLESCPFFACSPYFVKLLHCVLSFLIYFYALSPTVCFVLLRGMHKYVFGPFFVGICHESPMQINPSKKNQKEAPSHSVV